MGFYPFAPSSGGVTLPVSVPNGGTGAVTAAAARTSLSVMQVLYPSGVTSGVTDAANIAAAIAALPASGGVVRLAASGPWYIQCGQITGTTGQYVDAEGCYINATGAGDVFRFVDTTNYATRTLVGGAGLLGFPVVDGTATTGNSSAFHGGDILQLACEVQARNFAAGTTSKGVWFDNQYWFTEQLYGRVYVIDCAAGMVFDNSANLSGSATSSFARPDVNVYLAQIVDNVLGDGVVLQNGSVIYDGILGIFGNMVTTTAANTAAVLRITGQGAGGSNTNFSEIANTNLVIGVESDTAEANGPMTIFYGSGNNSITECWGGIDFPFGRFTQSNLPGQEDFVYTGPVNGDATLEQYGWSFQSMVTAPAGLQLSQFVSATAVTANGQTIGVGQVSYIRLTAAAAFTGLILNNLAGLYGQVVVVVNESAFPLTFAVPATSTVASGFVIPAGSQQTYVYDHFTGLWYGTQPQEFTAALATAFTSATGTAQQNVTGLAAYLSVGTWKVRGWFPYVGAGTVGSTQKFAFTFAGTASASSYVTWVNQAAAYSAPVTGAAVTTAITTATITATPYYMEFTATLIVTAAGLLQLTVQSTTSGDEITIEGGAFLEATQVA